MSIRAERPPADEPPQESGYVKGFNHRPDDPTTIDWKVGILSGDYAGSKATIRKECVPIGIRRGGLIALEVEDVNGDGKDLVAINVRLVTTR